jgi:hypothetical protein
MVLATSLQHHVGNIVRFSVQGSLKVSTATVQVFIGAHSPAVADFYAFLDLAVFTVCKTSTVMMFARGAATSFASAAFCRICCC